MRKEKETEGKRERYRNLYYEKRQRTAPKIFRSHIMKIEEEKNRKQQMEKETEGERGRYRDSL